MQVLEGLVLRARVIEREGGNTAAHGRSEGKAVKAPNPSSRQRLLFGGLRSKEG